MGGMHIVGTERHEARRIDNQLRGRAGRQGDPGSSRFYISLEDDLMRIFAGEWVKSILSRLGMEAGQSIESNMVSRRIEAAQKKVEEHNFDIRKNLLEYDEVMDYQRKRVYGFRQEILDGGNCKIRVLEDARQSDRPGPGSLSSIPTTAPPPSPSSRPSGWASNSTPPISPAAISTEADRTAARQGQSPTSRRRSSKLSRRTSAATSNPTEWSWQAMANTMNTRYGLKLNDHQLKKIGRDNLSQFLIRRGGKECARRRSVGGTALSSTRLGHPLGLRLGRLKFSIKLEPAQLDGQARGGHQGNGAGADQARFTATRKSSFPSSSAWPVSCPTVRSPAAPWGIATTVKD